ncbi:hypothetical protein FA95DRAFT_360946 [Auriscalpium vulgare]|uniref:Uncharacterized protein n=1 Tax=Auriscalpium vulgare TaxID=40419 RepID=A0ACB8RIV0_9AGAM|nr:hypothetical protein FA95DRAFT_360946 [Auriscalpium vulgare]
MRPGRSARRVPRALVYSRILPGAHRARLPGRTKTALRRGAAELPGLRTELARPPVRTSEAVDDLVAFRNL